MHRGLCAGHAARWHSFEQYAADTQAAQTFSFTPLLLRFPQAPHALTADPSSSGAFAPAGDDAPLCADGVPPPGGVPPGGVPPGVRGSSRLAEASIERSMSRATAAARESAGRLRTAALAASAWVTASLRRATVDMRWRFNSSMPGPMTR